MNTATPAQLQALALMAKGMRAKEAAAHLGLSPWTVKDHIHNACRRMGAKNATHAVAIALTSGQISAADVEAV